MRIIALLGAACVLAACEKEAAAPAEVQAPITPITKHAAPQPADKLNLILDSQPADFKARYQYRHPAETLAFFGIKPGMTVLEHLPGGGWYSQILAPLLGSEGTLIGVDYNMALWPHFQWVTDDFLAERGNWTGEWEAKFENWGGAEAAKPVGTNISELDESYNGKVDVALFIRTLHNLVRFGDEHPFLPETLNKTYAALKPGGFAGVVQHEAREDKSDEWANGAQGYLKKSFVIKKFEEAGFEFVAEYEINQNELDQPGEEDFVWRLPPSYSTSKDDEAKKSEFKAIGESNRMTLLFRKPSA